MIRNHCLLEPYYHARKISLTRRSSGPLEIFINPEPEGLRAKFSNSKQVSIKLEACSKHTEYFAKGIFQNLSVHDQIFIS